MKRDLCESAKKGRRCGDDLCYGADVTLCGFDLDLYREITDEDEDGSYYQDDSDDDFVEPSTTLGSE